MLKPCFAFSREDYYLYYGSGQSCLIYSSYTCGLFEVPDFHPYPRKSLISFFKENWVFTALPFFFGHLDALSLVTTIPLASSCPSLTSLITSLTLFMPFFLTITLSTTSTRLVSMNMLFLFCSGRKTCKSTCLSIFFLCRGPRAPKQCLTSPPPPHSLHHSTYISLQSSSTLLLKKFSLERPLWTFAELSSFSFIPKNLVEN